MLGASLSGKPDNSPEYVKVFRPAVALGRGAMMRDRTELSSGNTLYFVASTMNSSCNSRSLSGIFAARSLLSE
jgi:hypothetical protein